jgi:site-specific recombinase XerD
MAVKRKLPYLHRRSDTSGWFFIRRVPQDLVEQVGHPSWRWLLAHDLPSARLKLPEAIAHTDRVISSLRTGSKAPEPLNSPIPRELDLRLLHGHPELMRELVSVGAPIPDHPELIASLPPEEIAGKRLVDSEELIECNIRLKTPRQVTINNWKTTLKGLNKYLGHDNLHLLTRKDAAGFRDHLIAKLHINTVILRINMLSSLFDVGVEEELFQLNPFDGVGKRLKHDHKEHIDYDMVGIDELAKAKFNKQNYVIYQLLRYTGARLAEILGIELEDIDLKNGLLHIIPKANRSLKTKASKRSVPIHPNIEGVLKELLMAKTDQPFLNFYNGMGRWGANLQWTKVIGVSAHKLRHNAVSMMRTAGHSELVIGRVVGHTVKGMTGQYGTVSVELLRSAVLSIK